MHDLDTAIELKPWPLTGPGSSRPFGYVVAIGTLPDGFRDDGLPVFRKYADFYDGAFYHRFELPDEQALVSELLIWLCGNLGINNMITAGLVNPRLVIRRTKNGHTVSLR